jgi:hypothetical protein
MASEGKKKADHQSLKVAYMPKISIDLVDRIRRLAEPTLATTYGNTARYRIVNAMALANKKDKELLREMMSDGIEYIEI